MTNIWLGTGRIDRRGIPRAKDALGMTGGFIGWRRELGFRDSANRHKVMGGVDGMGWQD